MSFDWKKTLATVAPTLATALGGPLAGVAVNVLAKAFGVTPDEASVSNVIATSDPEVLLRAKQAEQDFIVRLEQLGIEREKILFQDRDSARKLFSVDKKPQILLSVLFIAGYFIILGCIMSGILVVPAEFKDILVLLLGIITREVPTIMQFWFGSSSGSKDKQKNEQR